ncbi:MAG TPA: DUF423 domain-containing protein [Saprospiraceae bacterium]|nr:DUF423 domain-containing protein [Saprospiraceae bacterium]
MNDKFFSRLAGIAALFAALGVIMGAFGAHALKQRISPESIEVLKTGVWYLFIHSLACLLIAGLSRLPGNMRLLKLAGIAFLLGIILFSGSLFIISTKTVTGIEIGFFGIVTPIGGLCFIIGWISLTIWGFRTWRSN